MIPVSMPVPRTVSQSLCHVDTRRRQHHHRNVSVKFTGYGYGYAHPSICWLL